ncbi:MAG: diacylglycerol kinase family protein [Cyanobacteria bacterium P01_H01_bin.152]
MSYWQKRKAAFGHAFRGLADLVSNHPNAHLHLVATIAIVCLGLFFDFAVWEWIAVLLCMAIVWSAEAFNTALEYLTDLVSPDYHPLAGKAKDVAAAAVLCAALIAFVVGLLLVGPKLWQLLSS